MTGRADKFSPRRVIIRGLSLSNINTLVVYGERSCVGTIRAEDAMAHGWTIDVVGAGHMVDFFEILLSGGCRLIYDSVRLGSLWTPH